MGKRVFLIVADSFGVGETPDAAKYGDEGSNTLLSISAGKDFKTPNLRKMGLFNIDGVRDLFPGPYLTVNPVAAYARMMEMSDGKDTTVGHWEIAGIISHSPFPTYPEGFPLPIIQEFEKNCERKILCNLPYSGTAAISDFGEEHMKTGALIVYTSADSVFQIASHEEVIPVTELYQICGIARKILQGEHAVARVIARPFAGKPGEWFRTPNRRDFSLPPPGETMLSLLSESGMDVIAIGKINDIFAGSGITESFSTHGNHEGKEKLLSVMKGDFNGLCFLNLVDFDMIYGHRNDIEGYAKAISDFDKFIPFVQAMLREEDLLFITADHGCDPSHPGTDHTREYVPLLVQGDRIIPKNLGTRSTFADVAASVLDYFDYSARLDGRSFLPDILRNTI
jgi:phosphopentomutase